MCQLLPALCSKSTPRNPLSRLWCRKPEARAAVEERRPAVEAAQQKLQAVEQRRDALLREAKAALGLWSGEAGGRP